MAGPVEVDETCVGGNRRNMSASKRKQMAGRGTVGKTTVVGMKDRETSAVAAKVVSGTDKGNATGFRDFAHRRRNDSVHGLPQVA